MQVSRHWMLKWVVATCLFFSTMLAACAEGLVDGATEDPVVALCTMNTVRTPTTDAGFGMLYAGRGFGASGNHLGRDIRAAEGTPISTIGCGALRIYRAASGYGTLVAVVEHTLAHPVMVTNGAGQRVTVTKFLSIYGHLRKTRQRTGAGTGLSAGSLVREGEILGYVERDELNGDGAEHVHFGIRLQSMADAQRQDPTAWFRGYDSTPSRRQYFADPETFLRELRAAMGPFPLDPPVEDAMMLDAAQDVLPTPPAPPMPPVPPTPPPPPVDAGTPMTPPTPPTTRELIVTASSGMRGSCPSGLRVLTWDDRGRVLLSDPDRPLTVRFPWSWRGFLMVGARCDSVYYTFDPARRTARAAGMESIRLDGEELVDTVQTCDDPWGIGTKLSVPLERTGRGSCPE